MQEKVNRITSLIEKHLEEELSQAEQQELNEWLAESESNRLFFQQITDKEILREKLKLYAGANSEAIWAKTLQKIGGGKLVSLYPEKKPFKIVSIAKYAAAAAAIILVSVGTWYYTSTHTSHTTTAKTENNTPAENSLIVPGSTKAVLTLADGSTIVLNNAQNGSVAQQGQMHVTKVDGRLIYNLEPNSNNTQNGQNIYNTVTTPRGGEYQVTLPDGSKVWLNAASSLRFPIAFAGNERIVELTGEAYFEVNPQNQHLTNKEKAGKMPFVVKIITPSGNKSEVEVLGTHFNVMAYSDEAAVKTTLLEGSVKVTSGNNSRTIKPGEQAKLNNGGIDIKNVNGENVVGWTTGTIPVGDLDYTLQQIARWYDLNIVYEGKKPEFTFDGKIRRDANINDIIGVLNANLNTSNIKVRLEQRERKIVVTS